MVCWPSVCSGNADPVMRVPVKSLENHGRTVTAIIDMLLLTRAQKSAGSAAQLLQPAVLASCAAVQVSVPAHVHAEQPADALCCKEQLHMHQS